MTQAGLEESIPLPYKVQTCAVLLLSLLFLSQTGIRVGELNLYFYLLQGIRQALPTFLDGDWYTMHTTPYHIPWNYFVATLVRANMLEAGLALGTVLMIVGFCASTYAFMRALDRDAVLSWGLVLLIFAGSFTRGIGDWDLLPSCLEPFGVAGVALVAGVACLCWNRPFSAGIALGACAFMHAHLAVLTIMVLLATTALQLRSPWKRDLLSIWIPFVLLATPTLWRIAYFAGAPGGKEAYAILSQIDPAHYTPWLVTWSTTICFVGACSMGIGGYLALQTYRKMPIATVFVFMAAVLVVASLIICRFDVLPALHRTYPWRLSSFVNLIGFGLGLSVITRPYLVRSQTGWRRGCTVGFILVGLVLVAISGTQRLWFATATAAIAIAFCWLTEYVQIGRSFFVRRRAFALAIVLLGMIPAAYRELSKSHLDFRPAEPARTALYNWVRTASAHGSVFAADPTWKDFRLVAQRALVADWAVIPYYAPEVFEWRRRIVYLTGVDQPLTSDQVTAGYQQLDCSRARMLQQNYGVSYVITDRSKTLPCGEVAYRDASYSVIQMQRP